MNLTAEEIAQARKTLSEMQVPATWKLEGFDTCTLSDDPQSEVQSVGAVYMDKSTSGINLKRYRLYWHRYTERYGLVERSIKDFGKFAYNCMLSNKTQVQMNEYLATL